MSSETPIYDELLARFPDSGLVAGASEADHRDGILDGEET
ncbi:hypothetical protein BCF44_113129 [Kutzneria buriramensis]|uniref:Uncharacterized protein n=1 Tax=Kutzneria buriramensis TaxID=1045776 RepID=A0A3E0H818_9PSEU|nr:hypothetical protein BCF44_113129 [Kutzneria buriramensis]